MVRDISSLPTLPSFWGNGLLPLLLAATLAWIPWTFYQATEQRWLSSWSWWRLENCCPGKSLVIGCIQWWWSRSGSTCQQVRVCWRVLPPESLHLQIFCCEKADSTECTDWPRLRVGRVLVALETGFFHLQRWQWSWVQCRWHCLGEFFPPSLGEFLHRIWLPTSFAVGSILASLSSQSKPKLKIPKVGHLVYHAKINTIYIHLP